MADAPDNAYLNRRQNAFYGTGRTDSDQWLLWVEACEWARQDAAKHPPLIGDGDQYEEAAHTLKERRAALIERIGTVADMTASKPLEGELGDIAYDLLRQAAAQMSSDHKALGGDRP